MPFVEACSCRVWAIDGWVDDATSKLVNDDISTIGTMLFSENYAGTHNEKVAQFLPSRHSVTTSHQCVIYGEFEFPGDVTPTHMWMEYQGYIYDTIPGAPLRRIPATALSRLHPPSCGGAFAPGQIGRVDYTLSSAHIAILGRAAGHWTAWPHRAGSEYFNP